MAGRAGVGGDRTAGRRGRPARPRPDRSLGRPRTRSARRPPISRRSSGRRASTGRTSRSSPTAGARWSRRTCRPPGSARHDSCCSIRRRSRSPRSSARPRRPQRDARRAARRPVPLPSPRTRHSPRATWKRRSSWRPRSTWRRPGRSCSRTATGTPAWPRCRTRPPPVSTSGWSAAIRRPAAACRTSVAAVFAARYGADHVTTIVGAPHSPQGRIPTRLNAALRQALD